MSEFSRNHTILCGSCKLPVEEHDRITFIACISFLTGYSDELSRHLIEKKEDITDRKRINSTKINYR